MNMIIFAVLALIAIPLPAFAGIPLERHDLVSLYGKSDNPNGAVDGWDLIFHNGDMTIRARSGQFGSDSISEIEYERQTPFNPMEIADILKPLATEEEWKQVDDNNWILPNAKVKAHWDGESKITVQ